MSECGFNRTCIFPYILFSILSLCGTVWVRENSFSGIFYGVLTFTETKSGQFLKNPITKNNTKLKDKILSFELLAQTKPKFFDLSPKIMKSFSVFKSRCPNAALFTHITL